jgi:hypothetical protein
VTALQLSTLPEYEPPLLAVPPAPDDPFEDSFDARTPVPAPLPWAPPGLPIWDEPGQLRDRLSRFMCQVLEVLDGRRPIDHLRALVDAGVYHALWTRMRQGSRTGRAHRLRSLHTCQPAPGVAELCATVAVTAPHTRRPAVIAIAARVERQRTGWLCTFLRPLYPGRVS